MKDKNDQRKGILFRCFLVAYKWYLLVFNMIVIFQNLYYDLKFAEVISTILRHWVYRRFTFSYFDCFVLKNRLNEIYKFLWCSKKNAHRFDGGRQACIVHLPTNQKVPCSITDSTILADLPTNYWAIPIEVLIFLKVRVQFDFN